MIRISRGKPHITQGEDRWGSPMARWYVNGYGLVCVDKWMKLQAFEEPPHEPLVWESPADIQKRIERQMSLAGRPTTVWEFDALCPDLVDRIRFIALFGGARGDKLVAWTWADAHVRYPLLRAWCSVKNQLPAIYGWLLAVTDRR